MGTRLRNSISENGEMLINLFGPGMTALHKAGLAGLWMSLKAIEEENGGRTELANGCWERGSTHITLRWEGASEYFFSELFKRSFKIDAKRMIWLPALGAPLDNPQHSVVLQEALLGTFLQHGKTRNSDPAQKPSGVISIDIDGKPHLYKYHGITEYAHQKMDFLPDATNSLAGWLFPGGVVRHTALQNSTALEEPPERALLLRYSPLGIVFFEIRSRSAGTRPYYAFVVPEIHDLSLYATARATFVKYGVQQLFAAGTADAAYRVMTEMHASSLLSDINSLSCKVFSFGTVPWSSQQKTRVMVLNVHSESEEHLRIFRLCMSYFVPRFVSPEKGEPFWDVPQIPDLIAHNLSIGNNWWDGFAEFVCGDKGRMDHVFGFIRDSSGKVVRIVTGEKGGLNKMIENLQVFPDGPESIFVQACHEAWRRRMGKIGEKAKREGSSFPDQVNREFEKLRVEFSRCKNASTLREAVTNFWARSGSPLSSLQDNWNVVLSLLDEKNWRKAKDLALLALASYKPSKEEEENLKTNISDVTQGGK